jgi:uncharacterized protein involved in oxidation of intracellular sulfur
MSILLILNDPPYGTERSYNGLRLAASLCRSEENQLYMFLIGDAVACARSGQKVPQGYYNIQSMLHGIIRRGATIGVCGTCMDARGLRDEDLLEGTRRSSMEELSGWTQEAAKVISF